MPFWSIELLAALAASFVAVLIGSGGDILFLSSILFLVPLLLHEGQSTFSMGLLVAAQGIVATLVGGAAYYRIAELKIRDLTLGMAVVVLGALSGSILAYLLPSVTLRAILALAITVGAARVIVVGGGVGDSHRVGHSELGKAHYLAMFAIAVLTGGLGVGGGFLFFITLMRLEIPPNVLRGLTLILTFTNLVTSFVVHVIAVPVDLNGIGGVTVGALAGSVLATFLIRRLDERLALWGLRTLLLGSAVMSWISVGPFRVF